MIRYKKGCLPKSKNGRLHVTKNGDFNDNIFTFDVENSNGYLIKGKIQPFDFTKEKDFYKDIPKFALVYIWQASINEVVYYGRTLEEFYIFLEELQEKYKGILTIWVHNLSHEFQFLLNILQFEKIFARSPHKVIYADFENIRFRCSYFLTRLSLNKWATEKQLPVKKLVGNIDYNAIYTPNTVLPQKNLDYSENDCLIIYYGIKQYLEKYGHIANIPLTQTGEVRKALKQKFNGNLKHYNLCTDLLPRNANEYALALSILWGGYTHANYLHANRILHNVFGDDEASEYPFCMCAYKYPMSKLFSCKNWKDYYKKEEFTLILDITFTGFESVLTNNYISFSKCYNAECYTLDNGRVSYAENLSITMTGIDFEIAEKCYKWKSMQVNHAFFMLNEYLPKEIIDFVLDSYSDKTTLKGLEEHNALYMYKKQMLNSVFGMMITALIQENVIFENDEWSADKLTPEAINIALQEKKKKPFKNWLSFWWGCLITARARNDLWRVVTAIDKDVAYCDTDSCYHLKKHDEIFDIENKRKDELLKKMCEYYNIDFSLTRPLDIKGVQHPLGHWERDETDENGVCYGEFKTLGAKRYCYRKGKKGKLKITVAGVNKEKGVVALHDNIKNFNENLVFGYEESGRLIATYLSNMRPVIWNEGEKDEYESTYQYGINLMPSTYSMDISDMYLDAIEILSEFKENLSDFSAKDLHDKMQEMFHVKHRKGKE